MSTHNCDDFCMAAIALAENFDAGIPQSEIDAHLNSCIACRTEVSQLLALNGTLDVQDRASVKADLWQGIDHRLHGQVAHKWSYAALIIGLLVYKLIEFVPDAPWSLMMQFIPVVVATAVLLYLRQNPFRIHTGLTLGKEEV